MRCWGRNGWGQLNKTLERILGTSKTEASLMTGHELSSKRRVSDSATCRQSYRDVKESQAGKVRKVYGWGTGGDFQLATTFPHQEVGTPHEIEQLRGLPIAEVAASWLTSYALTDSGRVYGWGSNRHYQLLQPQKEGADSHVEAPAPLSLPFPVKKVVAGRAHTVFLTRDGTVFTLGANELGQLGNGRDGEGAYSAELVEVAGQLEGHIVTQVAVGLDHNLALTSKGQVFGWGMAAEGQLGLGTTDDVQAAPEQVLYDCLGADLPPIAKLFAGADHSGLLTREGTLYVCGSNLADQLGVASSQEYESALLPIPVQGELKDRRVIDASFGATHSFAITEDHSVYVWGWNQEGKLGLSKDASDVCLPVFHSRLTALRPKLIRAGGGHTVVVSHDDQLYTFGLGEHGRLAQASSNESLWVPTPIALLNPPRTFSRIVDLFAGIDHTLLVVE